MWRLVAPPARRRLAVVLLAAAGAGARPAPAADVPPAAGTAAPRWQDRPVSILASQIGYHPRNVKHVYLRSLQAHPPGEFFDAQFQLVNAATDQPVFRGRVQPWGRRWESFWWVLDFTPWRGAGEFYVRTGKLKSSAFRIADGIFQQTGLDVIALDQLEQRIYRPEKDHGGEYRHGPPDVRIYRDCGGPYAELEPVGTCVYALMDLYDLLGDRFPAADRQRMLALAKLGADYFVAAQRHTDDPETDGMFYHSLLVNNRDTWAGEIFTYLDTAYGLALLAKAHQFFKDRDPPRAARYLAAARSAWLLCTRRPYHTPADHTLPKGAYTYFWNVPPGIQETFGRCLYNIPDKDWKLPAALRTRDRLPFIEGSARLYEITGERQYLDQAVAFAEAVMARQFTDWEHPIEGCCGNFYEFPDRDDVFFHEFMQGGFWWEGNVEALNLDGFMRLLRLAPTHPRAAAWLNTIRTYADYYARPATTVNPLGLYPVACYPDPQHGGLKFFQNTLMGSSCLYGFSAKNFLRLGAALADADFQLPALAGVNFIAGLNPGVPNAYRDTAWDPRSLILGIGRSWFGPAHPGSSPKGSVPNGFCAAPQFWQPGCTNFIASEPDRPAGLISPGGGLYFNEDWILHSHAYVQAVARLEAPYALRLKIADHGTGVAARVTVELRECAPPHGRITRAYAAAADGTLTITDLPTPCNGTVRLAHAGRELTRPVAAIAGGRQVIAADFARAFDVTLEVPADVAAGGTGKAVVTVANTGADPAEARLALGASGVALAQTNLCVQLEAGRRARVPVAFTAGARVMPYLVRAVLADGAPPREFYATGRIHAERKP